MRYRHLDNDLIRAARQQSFLGEAKNQIGIGSVFSDRKELLRIFGQSVRTDIDSRRRDPLAAEARGRVGRQADPGGPVPGAGRRRRLGQRRHRRPARSSARSRASWPPGRPTGPRGTAKATTAKRSKRTRRRQPIAVAGLIRNRNASENIAAPLQVKLGRLPVYYPTLMSATGSYRVDDSRAYDIVDRANKRHRAYRIVAYDGRIGQYYGIQGTDWRSPPILDNPSSSVTSGGRTFKLFYDGSRLQAGRLAHAPGLLLGLQHAPAHADQQADARARPLGAVARRALDAWAGRLARCR